MALSRGLGNSPCRAVRRFGRFGFDRPWTARTAEGRRAGLTNKHPSDADVLGGERQHRQLACSLEGDVQRSLVSGACARFAPRFNFAAFGQEPPQAAEILVVDFFDFVDTELADLAPRGEFSAATGAELTRSAPWAGPCAAWPT